MFERHVSVPEVLSVLRRGRIVEGPARGARWHWRCSLAHALRERELTVAVALGYLDFRFGQRPWRPGRPALADWAARIADRDSIRATVPTA